VRWRSIFVDLMPILLHTFGSTRKHGVARTTQRRLPKVYSLGYRPPRTVAPIQECRLIELESSSSFTHQMTADAATLAKTN
jgi:hypothetical protein